MTEETKVGRWSPLAAMAVILLVGVPIWAWAMSILWGWFVVPLGVPEVSVAHAYGLLMIAWGVKYRRGDRRTIEDNAELWGVTIGYSLGPILAIAAGRLVLYAMECGW